MSKAKIFCKGGYVKNEHALNILEYAGEKISSQQLFLKDGTVIHYDGEDKITLNDIDSSNIEKVVLTLKDGKQVPLSWDKYNGEVSKKVTSSQVKNIQGDNICENEARKMEDMDIDEYLKYVANRKGVVKDDGYGLFGLNGNVDIAQARKMIMEDYPKSIKWSYIMSLRPEDAYVEGYDNRKAWKDLVCSIAPQIAKAYNISFENLVINAAYHDDKEHKHIHLIFYSKNPNEGFIYGGNKNLIKSTRKLKSLFLNNIFKDDVEDIKNLINSNRKNLKQSLLVSLSKKDIEDENLISMFQNVAEKLDSHTGRMDYGYLPPELKSEVNYLLSYMIKNTDELSELFENLCDSQKQYIEMYNQDEEKIKNQLDIFKASFLNPKKGQADLQNAIVNFLGKYNDEKVTSLPLENLPATKEKKVDDSLPFKPLNASENFENYSNNEKNLSEYSDNDYSSFDDLDDTTEKSQATKGKKGNDSLPFEPPNASESFENYSNNEKNLSEYSNNDFSSFADLNNTTEKLQATKGKKELSQMIYKDISKAAYKSCCKLFNPKIKNTVLQEELLLELKGMSQSKKYSKEYTSSAVKSFQIMMTDKDFYDTFNKSLDKNIEKFLKDNKYDKHSQNEVNNYINSFKNGKITSAHWYSQFFADKIYDQQYFQLMKSFEEFNVPLRKEMRKNIIDNFENVAPVPKEIKEIKDEIPKFLKDDDVNNYVKSKISSIWSTVTNTPEYQIFKENNYRILDQYMDETADIKKYKKRFENTLDNVQQLMRPHFYMITQSEYIDELQISEALKNNDLFAPVKSEIKECLDNSITDYSYSSQFIKEKLLIDGDTTKDILRCLYSQKDIQPIIDKWAENVIKSSGVKDKTKYYENFQLYLRGEPCEFENLFNYTKLTNYLRYYKNSYVEQVYKQVLKINKSEIPTKQIFKLIKDNYADFTEEFNNLNTICNDLKQAETDEEIEALKIEQSKLISKIGQKIIYKDEEFLKYIEIMNQSFKKHSGDNNIALTLENRFLSDIYSGDLWTVPNLYISFFAEKLPEMHLSEALKNKDLFEPVKKVIKDYIDNSIINTDNNTFSKLFIKEKLITGGDTTKDIVRGLYSVPHIQKKIDEWILSVKKNANGKGENEFLNDFKKYIHNEPCENEDLFKYSKLNGYAFFYKENYAENGYKAILKTMDEDIKSEMSVEISNKLNIMISSSQNNKKKSKKSINKEDTSKLLIELYKLPKPSDDCTEKELEEYILKKQKLISNIFINHLVLDKDTKGNKFENKKIKNYIESATKLFNQYAGNSDIAQDIEKLFLNKIHNGDFYIQPNSQISFFAENLPKQYIKKFLKQDKGKELLSPIYATLSKEIYGKILSNENNQVKDELKNIAKISKQLEEVETQEEKAKLINLANKSVLSIINDTSIDTTDLKNYLQEEIKKSVPKDIQNDVLEQLNKSFEKDVLNLPYGYMIFAMVEDYDLTTSKAIADIMRSDIKSFQSMIYKDIYEVLGQRPSKRLTNSIFKAMISYNQNIALESSNKQDKTQEVLKQSDIDIMSIFAALMEKPEYKDLYDKIYKNFSCELRKHCSCDDEQVEKMFQKAILEDDYKGINSSIKFMCENVSDIIKKINRQKAIAVLYIMCNTIARNLYDQNRDMQNHLGKMNSLNKGKNRFIEKSKRSTFEKTILNNYMI